MGQIVQYGNMHKLKPNEKVLKWCDQKNPNSEGEKTTDPLSRIIPIKETIDFSKKVVNHHNKSQKDISSCLKGTKLNKFQKQQQNPGSKSGPLSSTQGVAGASSTEVATGSSIQGRKAS